MVVETSFSRKGSLVFRVSHTYLDKEEKINITEYNSNKTSRNFSLKHFLTTSSVNFLEFLENIILGLSARGIILEGGRCVVPCTKITSCINEPY